jgi:hypothetical protein
MTQQIGKATFAGSKRYAAHCYRIHGLELWSDIELPELVRVEPDRPDLTVRLATIARVAPADSRGAYFHFSDEDFFFAWDAVGKFLVRDERTIEVEPAPGLDDRLLAFPLLGPVLAMTLHRRGALVLHASAVDVAGRAVAFLGNKGAGKSSIAAAMIEAGHALLTDDVLALAQDGTGAWRVEAAFPQLKLSPDASRTLTRDGALARDAAHPSITKRLHMVSTAFRTDSTPLARLFVLRRGERASIAPLAATDAFKALAGYSYAARFGGEALRGEAGARHLKAIGSVLGAAGISMLEVPDGLERMAEAVALVESSVRRHRT